MSDRHLHAPLHRSPVRRSFSHFAATNLLAHQGLEPERTQALCECAGRAGVCMVVVMGGTMEPPDAMRPWPNLGPTADRVWHASRLDAAGTAPVVLLSGGSDMTAALYAESWGMRQLMLGLGVPAAALLTEERGRNTRENAELSARLLRERGIQQILLVTSALHMRR